MKDRRSGIFETLNAALAMRSIRLFGASITAVALIATSQAFGETPLRVRGNIIAIDNRSITVKERTGAAFQLLTSPTTAYADVVPSRLDAIKMDSYIGTAVKAQGTI